MSFTKGKLESTIFFGLSIYVLGVIPGLRVGSSLNYYRQQFFASGEFFASDEFFVVVANCSFILKQCTCTQCVYVKNEKIYQHFEGFFLIILPIQHQQKLRPMMPLNLKLLVAIVCLHEFHQIARAELRVRLRFSIRVEDCVCEQNII